MSIMNPFRCDGCHCEKADDFFAQAYRRNELRHDRADPGLLCGQCAGARTGKRIAEEIAAKGGG